MEARLDFPPRAAHAKSGLECLDHGLHVVRPNRRLMRIEATLAMSVRIDGINSFPGYGMSQLLKQLKVLAPRALLGPDPSKGFEVLEDIANSLLRYAERPDGVASKSLEIGVRGVIEHLFDVGLRRT